MRTEGQDAKHAATSESTPIIARLTQEQTQVIELLRTLKPKWWLMGETGKQKIRNFIQHLHLESGISLTDLGKMVGKNSGYMSYMARALGIQPRDFEEARLAAIRQKVRKYERRPFHGSDEDKAYLLGLRHGDLSVSRPFGDAIRVSTSTTHPAMAQLFRSLFEPHGHVYQFPRIKKEMQSYEWNLHTILDDSFRFLLSDYKTTWEWVSQRETTLCSYLAGVWDAEGSVGIHPNAKVVSIRLTVYNTDTDLLGFLKQSLITLGCRPKGPYKEKSVGSRTSKHKIPHRKDYWRVAMFDFDESQSLLRRLQFLHPEKVAKKGLALTLKRGNYWDDVSARVQDLIFRLGQPSAGCSMETL